MRIGGARPKADAAGPFKKITKRSYIIETKFKDTKDNIKLYIDVANILYKIIDDRRYRV